MEGQYSRKGGKISEDVKETFKAYKLVRYRDPIKEKYVKSHGWRMNQESGKCYLQLVAEEESMDLLYAMIPPREFYFEGGYGIVKQFYMDTCLKFEYLHVIVGDKLCFYHTTDIKNYDCSCAFNRIYESYDGDIILTTSSWYASQMRDIDLTFHLMKDGEFVCWINYDVDFIE